MIHCLLVILLWGVVVFLLVFLLETLLRLFWPDVPWQVLVAMRLLGGVLVLLWIVGCLSALFPGPPALPGGR